MPRYFFDCTQDGASTPDYEGVELASLDEAQREAVRALPAFMADTLKRGHARDFGMVVRDRQGPVFSARLALTTMRLTDSNWV